MQDFTEWKKDIEAKDKDVNKRTKLKGVSLIFNSRMFFFRAYLLIIIYHFQVSAKVQKAKQSVPLPPIRNQVDIKHLKDKKNNEIFSKSEVK